jgi:hypothetical protein
LIGTVKTEMITIEWHTSMMGKSKKSSEIDPKRQMALDTCVEKVANFEKGHLHFITLL